MGQYYLITNLDKKQYLHPHKFNDGLKLLEFGCSAIGAMTALAVLPADGNGRGGGDLHSNNPIIGSWAGDRIVVAGDYADEGKFMSDLTPDTAAMNLYAFAKDEYEDISEKAMAALLDDKWIAKDIEAQTTYEGSPFAKARHSLRPDIVVVKQGS